MEILITILICLICFLLGKYYAIYTLKKKIIKKPIEKKVEYNFENSDLKMVFLVRQDLKMSAGKIVTDVAHSAVALFEYVLKSEDQYHRAALLYWNENMCKKIVLRIPNLEIMKSVSEECKNEKIPYVIINDSGNSQTPLENATVMGIGVEDSSKINKITGRFKLMR